MRRRPSVLALVIGSAAVLLASILGIVPAAARVEAARAVPGMRTLLDVVCRDDGSCLGVGYTPQNVGALVLLRAAGPSGPVRPVPGTLRLSGVTCHQGGGCLAVGQGAAGGVAVQVGLDGTPGPLRPVSGATALYGVACPTETTCLATGDVLNPPQPPLFHSTTSPLFTVVTNGQPAPAQRFPRSTRRMIGIACPNATTCLAAGTGAIAVLTGSGGTWSAGVTFAPGSFATGHPTDAISCPTTTCYATAAGFIPTGDGYVGVPAMMPVSLSGVVGPVQILSNESGFAADISCVLARTCTVVGQDNLAAQGLVVDVSRGSPAPATRWPEVNSFVGVSCVAPASCGMVGNTPTGAVFAWRGPVPG